MKFSKTDARIFVPDGTEVKDACTRVTHLGVGAHQDDLEIMAYHGIAECYGRTDHWFGGVTCTDGRGSARTGTYADLSDDEMAGVRRDEQDKAAVLGEYGIMIQLGHPSRGVKEPGYPLLKDDLIEILNATRPTVLYTHNPADRHETHTGVFVSLLQAVRELPPDARPARILGCEVWRGLDWLPDESKVALDVSPHPELFEALLRVFDSQVAGGKRYDLATIGRARANATYFTSHEVDKSDMLWFAMDLTSLVLDSEIDPLAHIGLILESLVGDVTTKLRTRLGG